MNSDNKYKLWLLEKMVPLGAKNRLTKMTYVTSTTALERTHMHIFKTVVRPRTDVRIDGSVLFSTVLHL